MERAEGGVRCENNASAGTTSMQTNNKNERTFMVAMEGASAGVV